METPTKLLIASAVAPIAVLLLWTWRRDRLPEPPRIVLATFALGALATLPILVAGISVSWLLGVESPPRTLADALITSFILAALIEECFKYAVLSRFAARHSAFDEPYDGIVYGVAASLGFACVENVLYVLQAGAESVGTGITVAVSRALLAVPMHTACGAIMGTFMGLSRFRRGSSRSRLALVGLFAAIMVHGLYDAALFVADVLAPDGESLVPLAGLGVAAATLLASWLGVVAAASWLRRHQRT